MTSSVPDGKERGGRNRFGPDVVVRTQSAVVLGLSVLALTALGGWAFVVFTALMAGLVLGEWLGMTRARQQLFVAGDLPAAAALVVILFKAFGAGVALASGGFLFVVLLVSAQDRVRRIWAGLGLLYALVPAVALQSLRDSFHFGLWAIVFLFAVVWTTDVAAFFTGRAIGGPKLLVSISPKKTWSGAVGGLIGAVAAGGVVATLAGLPTVVPVLVLAAFASVVSQAGDLYESGIKRFFMVKDSSQLIPGHGGVMDRVDGLVAAAVLLAAIGWLRGGVADSGAGILIW